MARQARSAWNHEENGFVPAGRLKPYYIQNQVEHHRTRIFQQEYLAFLKRHEHSTRCRLLMPGLSFTTKICGTDNDFNRPSGTGPLHRYPGTSCLGLKGRAPKGLEDSAQGFQPWEPPPRAIRPEAHKAHECAFHE
jgi:hypothetical protein